MFVHWTIKQAFLLFYLRLSPRKGFQIAVYGIMALNTAFTIINWSLAFLQCRPMDALFHPKNYPNAQCLSQSAVMMVPTALVCTCPFVSTLSCLANKNRIHPECHFRYFHPRPSYSNGTGTSNETKAKSCCSWCYRFRITLCHHGNMSLCASGADGDESGYNIRSGTNDNRCFN